MVLLSDTECHNMIHLFLLVWSGGRVCFSANPISSVAWLLDKAYTVIQSQQTHHLPRSEFTTCVVKNRQRCNKRSPWSEASCCSVQYLRWCQGSWETFSQRSFHGSQEERNTRVQRRGKLLLNQDRESVGRGGHPKT